MLVRELILALQTFPQHMEVMVQDQTIPIIAHSISATIKETIFIKSNEPEKQVVILTTEKL